MKDLEITGTINLDSDNYKEIFKIVTLGLYSDKLSSIIRELASNCQDAHYKRAEVDKDFDVDTCYSILGYSNGNEYYVSFRDYGIGLSPEDMRNIYVNIFSSTKRNDNLQIGKFGLGSKSPFSYTDFFQITTNWGTGQVAEYDYYLNNESMPTLRPTQDLAGNQIFKTEEEANFIRGTEIKIKLHNKNDYIELCDKAQKVLFLFDNVSTNLCELQTSYTLFKDFGWLVLYSKKYAETVKYVDEITLYLNNIPYYLNFNSYFKTISENEVFKLKMIIAYVNANLIINLKEKNHEGLIINQSRETISVTNEFLEFFVNNVFSKISNFIFETSKNFFNETDLYLSYQQKNQIDIIFDFAKLEKYKLLKSCQKLSEFFYFSKNNFHYPLGLISSLIPFKHETNENTFRFSTNSTDPYPQIVVNSDIILYKKFYDDLIEEDFCPDPTFSFSNFKSEKYKNYYLRFTAKQAILLFKYYIKAIENNYTSLKNSKNIEFDALKKDLINACYKTYFRYYCSTKRNINCALDFLCLSVYTNYVTIISEKTNKIDTRLGKKLFFNASVLKKTLLLYFEDKLKDHIYYLNENTHPSSKDGFFVDSESFGNLTPFLIPKKDVEDKEKNKLLQKKYEDENLTLTEDFYVLYMDHINLNMGMYQNDGSIRGLFSKEVSYYSKILKEQNIYDETLSVCICPIKNIYEVSKNLYEKTGLSYHNMSIEQKKNHAESNFVDNLLYVTSYLNAGWDSKTTSIFSIKYSVFKEFQEKIASRITTLSNCGSAQERLFVICYELIVNKQKLKHEDKFKLEFVTEAQRRLCKDKLTSFVSEKTGLLKLIEHNYNPYITLDSQIKQLYSYYYAIKLKDNYKYLLFYNNVREQNKTNRRPYKINMDNINKHTYAYFKQTFPINYGSNINELRVVLEFVKDKNVKEIRNSFMESIKFSISNYNTFANKYDLNSITININEYIYKTIKEIKFEKNNLVDLISLLKTTTKRINKLIEKNISLIEQKYIEYCDNLKLCPQNSWDETYVKELYEPKSIINNIIIDFLNCPKTPVVSKEIRLFSKSSYSTYKINESKRWTTKKYDYAKTVLIDTLLRTNNYEYNDFFEYENMLCELILNNLKKSKNKTIKNLIN